MWKVTFACGFFDFFFEFGSLFIENFLENMAEFLKAFFIIFEGRANNWVKGKLSVLHLFPIQSDEDNQIDDGEQFPRIMQELLGNDMGEDPLK